MRKLSPEEIVDISEKSVSVVTLTKEWIESLHNIDSWLADEPESDPHAVTVDDFLQDLNDVYCKIVNQSRDVGNSLDDGEVLSMLRHCIQATNAELVCHNRLTGFNLPEEMRFRSVFDVVTWFGGQTYRYSDRLCSLPSNRPEAEDLVRERENSRRHLPRILASDWIVARVEYECAWLRHFSGLIPEPVRVDLTEDVFLTDADSTQSVRPRKGIRLLMAAAIWVNESPHSTSEIVEETKKKWRNRARRHALPKPVPASGQTHYFDASELSQWLRDQFPDDWNDDFEVEFRDHSTPV